MNDTQVTLRDVSGPFADFTTKLSGESGQQWLEAFKRFLRKENPWSTHQVASREVWKKLAIGAVGSVERYREQLEKAGFKVSYLAYNILKQTPIATEPAELDLVVVSVAELGFTGVTRYDDICRRAKEQGLMLCPAEIGPALRLSYTDQPMGEWPVVAMEHLTDSVGYPHVFFVVCDEGGRWLNTACGRPDGRWFPGFRFVFVRPA